MSTMGNVYIGLGLDLRGQSLLEKALMIQRHTLGADNPETLETAASLATELRYEGKYPESEKLERETVASQTRVLGAQNAKTLRTQAIWPLHFSGKANTPRQKHCSVKRWRRSANCWARKTRIRSFRCETLGRLCERRKLRRC